MKTCYTHNSSGLPAGESCNQCREVYDSAVSPCSRCGAMVSNGAFFKRSSPHFKGTCKAPVLWPIPASFLERKTMKPRSYDCLTAFMASSNLAEESNKHVFARKVSHVSYMHGQKPAPAVIAEQSEPEPIVDPLAERLAQLLEEQNELLRTIARKAA